MLIFPLLKYVAEGMPTTGSVQVRTALRTVAADPTAYAMQAGLGPLLHRATAGNPPPLKDAMAAAYLAARVRHSCLFDAARRAIDLCAGMGVPVTLLKGISISEQCYPAAYLRPMSDIDLLIPATAREAVEARFLQCGYGQDPNKMGPDSHHGEPLLDPDHFVWIELHEALFPGRSRLRQGRLFSASGIAKQTVATSLADRPVQRLSDALQLIYISCYWVRDVSMHGLHPAFVFPVIDAVCLLTKSHPPDWQVVLDLVDNPIAAASLYILLAYLSRYRIVPIPEDVLAHLAASQPIVGRTECAILTAMVHRYLIGGRSFRPFNSWHIWTNLIRPGTPFRKVLSLPWNIVFPARYPDRYDAAWQAKRIAQRLRRPQHRTDPAHTGQIMPEGEATHAGFDTRVRIP